MRSTRFARLDRAGGDLERGKVLQRKCENDRHGIRQLHRGGQIRVGKRGREHGADGVTKGHPARDTEKGVKANDSENDAFVDVRKGGALLLQIDRFLQWHQQGDGAFKQQDLWLLSQG